MPDESFDLFISYRRSDAAGHARALYRDLCRRFDKRRIFFDRESIEAGAVFPERLREGVASCRALLALIAPGWLEAKTARGERRLDGEDDFVRQEIAAALQLGKKVIPVLFDDTPMPEGAQLPAPLRALAGRDALMLRGKNLEYDVQFEALVRILAGIPGMPAPLPAEEGVVVGGGLDFDVYRGARFIPIRLRAPLRAAFKPLIEDRTRIFAGRRQVFDRIMAFAAREEGGYLVITAPPGFGKTALVANLVAATPEAFAYHFFAPVYGAETLDEKFFLQNVLQQMAAWHGQRAELPDAINELRALYQEFVDTPLEHSQVLVLDGLDEVSQWKLAPYLGRRLPPRLHVIVTVRDVGQDWRTDYGFPGDQVTALPLGGLERGEIRDLFAGLGAAGARIAGDDALLDHVVVHAAYESDPGLGADPFYVRFLAEDVASAEVAPEEIPAQPQGLDAYLDRWWKQIVQLAGDTPVRDLFGTLAAAVGPIARADLETINASLRDDWAGDFFDQVLGRVRRVVRQHGDGRYSLAHPRLRRYVADPKRIGRINDYRQRLLDYCARWREHRSPYALAGYGAHLAEVGRGQELYGLFSGEWIAAHWSVLRTYGPLVADLDRAAKALLAAPAPDYPRIVALVVARQTGRELMLGFPEELFVAWTGQGEVERALACLAALGKGRGRAIDPLTAVAGKLLELHRKDADDYDARAAELLLQVADLLTLPRMTNAQLDALTALAANLPVDRGLPEGARLRLVRQAVEFAERADDPVLRAAGLGEIASALCTSAPELDTARDLLGRARAAIAGIDFVPDRVLVAASLLPALEALAPDEVLPALEELVAEGPALLEHGSLKKNPCIRLLERWHPAVGAQPERAAALLLRVATLYLEPSADYAGAALSVIVPHLCRLGRVSAALDLLDRCWEADAVEGARIVAHNVEVLRELAPDRMAAWLESARELTDRSYHEIYANREMFTGLVAGALAANGGWDAALALTATIRPRERADAMVALLRRAATAFGPDTNARDAVVDRIVAIADGLDDEDDSEAKARVAAVAAQVQAGTSRVRAERELARAAALCLAHLPEGDRDELLGLQAAALHEDGATGEVGAVLRRMSWVTAVARTVASLVLTDAVDEEHRELYTRVLVEELKVREGAGLYGDALRQVAPIVVRLARDAAPLAGTLGDYLVEQSETLPIDDRIAIYATISAGACLIDPERGGHHYAGLLDWIEALKAEGHEIAASTVAGVIVQLASAAAPLGQRLAPLAQRAAALADGFEGGDDAITVRGALCLIEAQSDCQAARTAMDRLVPGIAALAEVPPAALYLTRMIADVVGQRAGPNEIQARAASSLAEVVVRFADRCPAEAAKVFEQVIDQTLAIRSEVDRAQALIHVFGALEEGPVAWQQSLEGVLSGALRRAQLGDAKLEVSVFEAAVGAMCAAGDLDAAERLARQPEDASLVKSLLEEISARRERLALGELSVFERAFVEVDDGGLAHAVLHSVKVDKESEKVLEQLGEVLAFEQSTIERVRLLSTFLPQFAAPLRTLRGTGEIGRVIEEVERFDHAFVEAARIVGEGGEAPSGVAR